MATKPVVSALYHFKELKMLKQIRARREIEDQRATMATARAIFETSARLKRERLARAAAKIKLMTERQGLKDAPVGRTSF
jgi:hypothetical protein